MTRSKLNRFFLEEEATTTVEYAILLSVIGMAVIKACQVLGGEMSLVFQSTGDSMTNVTN